MMDGAQVTDNELPNNKSESGLLEPLQLLIWGQSKFLSFQLKKAQMICLQKSLRIDIHVTPF